MRLHSGIPYLFKRQQHAATCRMSSTHCLVQLWCVPEAEACLTELAGIVIAIAPLTFLSE